MNQDLLKNILDFLNKVPNRKYGDNYQLASDLEIYIKEQRELLIDIKYVLKTLRSDAESALRDRWDRSNSGFECQIELINIVLPKLKQLRNENR